MLYSEKDHTFVICAYKENTNLEVCIKSLLGQTLKGEVILSTSTPNAHIEKLCAKYGLPLFINEKGGGIAKDWNYGYNQAKTALVTVAHQDDYYEPDFLEKMMVYANKRSDFIILFSDYYEIKGKRIDTNLLLKIKRVLNFPLRFSVSWEQPWIRKLTMRFGCAICCPAVMIHKKYVGENPFDTRFINSCDYMSWVLLAERKGAFIHLNKKLMGHRIYTESTTSKNIESKARRKEDLEILSHYWPKPIARFINSIYVLSEKSNQVN